MWIYWILGILAFAVGFVNTAARWRNKRQTPALGGIPMLPAASLPRLTIVVPALDEERSAESAMRTLMALDYPDYEILAVNDRSSDRTGEILDRLAAEGPRLRVIHIRELPAGWLGKSHAMHVGSQQASGEWILFTDADVHFEPTALPRAISFAIDARADHVVVMPEVISTGFMETAFLGLFWTLFSFKWKPQRVADPHRKDYVGVGAFNLVRAEAYRKAGGHAAMPMEVLDDVKLGKVMKTSGARQVCLLGGSLVRVRWIEGIRGAVQGLTKNMFAALGFNPAVALLLSVLTLIVGVWPVIGLLVGPLGARLLCAAAIACMVWSTGGGAQVTGLKAYHALAYPLADLILVYIVFRSMLLTYRQGGIVWRGTHYPLSELRKGLV